MVKKQKVLRKGKLPTKFSISFGKTAYIPNVGAEMLDNLERSGLSICMTGEGMFLTTYEAIEEYLNDALEGEKYRSSTTLYVVDVKEVIDKTKNHEEIIGNVVFVA